MGAKNITFLTIAVLIAAGIGGFFFVQRGGIDLSTSERPVPDLKFTNYEGQEVSLASFSGKPLIVNAWASWCPFCVEELPDFISLQEEFKNKITIIAVNRGEQLATAKNYTDGRGLSDKLIFLLDINDTFYKAIGGFSMPETIFVDKEGKIIFHKRGPMSLEEMRRKVEDLFLKNNGEKSTAK